MHTYNIKNCIAINIVIINVILSVYRYVLILFTFSDVMCSGFNICMYSFPVSNVSEKRTHDGVIAGRTNDTTFSTFLVANREHFKRLESLIGFTCCELTNSVTRYDDRHSVNLLVKLKKKKSLELVRHF